MDVFLIKKKNRKISNKKQQLLIFIRKIEVKLFYSNYIVPERQNCVEA